MKLNTKIKFSTPSKMPCYSWSLQAIETCPASIKANGELVDACKGCYATEGTYRFGVVKDARAFNKEDWKRDEWVSEFITALDNQRYFRWFDSGDAYHTNLLSKMYEICLQTGHCKHWIPTRMYKFKKFKEPLNRLNSLPNVTVRFSSDSVLGEFTEGVHGSTILPDRRDMHGVTRCNAYRTDKWGNTISDAEFDKLSTTKDYGYCGSCRACWNKDVPVIGYVAHGTKMKSVVKNAIEHLQIA
jgi:hypothetical protein